MSYVPAKTQQNLCWYVGHFVGFVMGWLGLSSTNAVNDLSIRD